MYICINIELRHSGRPSADMPRQLAAQWARLCGKRHLAAWMIWSFTGSQRQSHWGGRLNFGYLWIASLCTSKISQLQVDWAPSMVAMINFHIGPLVGTAGTAAMAHGSRPLSPISLGVFWRWSFSPSPFWLPWSSPRRAWLLGDKKKDPGPQGGPEQERRFWRRNSSDHGGFHKWGHP